MISEAGGIDESLIGGNASAEGGGEELAEQGKQILNIVASHQLQKVELDADGYWGTIKDFFKQVKKHLEDTNPDRVEAFMANAPKAAKRIKKLAKKGELDFYCGESFNMDGMIGIIEWRDMADGEQKPCLLIWKDIVD